MDQTYCDNNYGAGSIKSVLNAINLREDTIGGDSIIGIFEQSRQWGDDEAMERAVSGALLDYPGNHYSGDPVPKMGEFVVLVDAFHEKKDLDKLAADGLVLTPMRFLSRGKAWGTKYANCYALYLIESVNGVSCRLG